MDNHTLEQHPIIRQFVEVRQQVLNRYWALLKLPPHDACPLDEEEVARFCQVLIDYTSMGHFQVYEHLLPAQGQANTQSKERFETLCQTTDEILEFNDCFEKEPNFINEKGNKTKLSSLGLALATRMEQEDYFLASL